MTRTVTAQLTSWLTTFEIALHLSADTAWRSMLMLQVRNVRISYGRVDSLYECLVRAQSHDSGHASARDLLMISEA